MADLLKEFFDADDIVREAFGGEQGAIHGEFGRPYGFLGERYGEMGADNAPKLTDYFNINDYFDLKAHYDGEAIVKDAFADALGHGR